MDPRMQERVKQWDSRPFTDGYDELSDLADSGFSGAVTAANAWLFMLNGRIVGIVEGQLETFDGASGTAYAAPDPALPLLCSMVSRGGETRAKYYTNKTPLREVDQTLQDGSFTGYIELSERVLSGDYYAVYYGGRRMAAAYIGNADRLLTGDEAFERAAEEVGIYEVIDVDIEVTDVPTASESTSPASPDVDAAGETESPIETDESPTEAESSADPDERAGPASAPDGVGITDPGEQPPGPTTPGITDEPAESADEIEDATPDAEPAESESPAAGASNEESGAADDAPAGDERPPASETTPDAVKAAAERLTEGGAWDDIDADSSESERTAEESAQAVDESASEPTAARRDEAEPSTDANASDDGDHRRRLEREAQWRETRNIPSIDPDRSPEPDSGDRLSSHRGESSTRSIARSAGSEGASTDDTQTTESERSRGERSDDALESDMLEREDTIDQLTQRVEELESRRDALRERADELESERDRVRAENQELTATVEHLRAKIEELEAAPERAGDAGATGTDRETELSPRRALSETNLFVRYGSKSRPTLERAHEGQADREEVAENLQLEHHTGFDAADVSVVGQPYEEFLTGSMEYRFVDWLTETLLYEVRDTGRADALADLYDAIPWIDRTELDATVSLADDDTDDVPDTVEFDVVAFDKMGNPLIVANINDSREPATREMLVEMEEAASAVKANYPDLGAAMVVTSSYFEPGALEVTEEATSGGFLSRSSKLSYVTLSRKQGGYHLCLVEARSGGFHMTVPEL